MLSAALVLALLAALLVSVRPARAQEGGVPAPSDRVFLPFGSYVHTPLSFWPPQRGEQISPNTWLAWSFDATGFPDPRYTVYLEKGDLSPDIVLARDLAATVVSPPTLEVGQRYYWQVEAVASDGQRRHSPVFTFRTFVPKYPPAVGEMVTIPAGEFMMGCDPAHDGGFGCRSRETPLHPVYLESYQIDRYEVTNIEYLRCVQAGACQPPRRFDSEFRSSYFANPAFDYYPVVYVSWWDSKEYCEWAGKRLPTEAEWEKAARGTLDTRPWPWGHETIDCTRANFTDTRWHDSDWIRCHVDTAQVGSYPLGASPYGVMDLSGNAFEWVWDRWGEYYYHSDPPYYNPMGAGGGNAPSRGSDVAFVLRGGSYRPDWYYPRAFNRHWGHHGDHGSFPDSPYYRNNQGGFRCAKSLP